MKLIRDNRGSTLIYVLVAATVLIMIGFLMASRRVNQSLQVQRQRVLAGRDNVLKIMELYTGDINALRNSRVSLAFDGAQRFLNCLFDGDNEGARAEPNNCVAKVAGVQQRYEYALYVSFPLNTNPNLGASPITFSAPAGTAVLAGGGASDTDAMALYDVSGKRCPSTVVAGSRLCPIQVITEFEPICESSTDTCNKAKEMVLYYTVKGVAPADDTVTPNIKTIDNKGITDSSRKPFRLRETDLDAIRTNL